VFDEQVQTMDREHFHIALSEEAKSFCINIPRTVSFACREKLKVELEVLQKQRIITVTPVIYPTEWYVPIVVILN
jgi:hypothetical protein